MGLVNTKITIMGGTGRNWTASRAAHSITVQRQPSPSCGTWPTPSTTLARPKTPRTPTEPATQEDALWVALCDAPDEGADIAELMRASGMTRPTLYRHLAVHADAGRAVQVSRSRWRAAKAKVLQGI